MPQAGLPQNGAKIRLTPETVKVQNMLAAPHTDRKYYQRGARTRTIVFAVTERTELSAKPIQESDRTMCVRAPRDSRDRPMHMSEALFRKTK